MKKLFLFLIVFLFPLLTYPATTVYENGTLKGYVNALNFKNATVTKSGIIAIVDASGGTGPAGTNGTNGSNATVAVANISVNYTQPMFKFIAGQNVTSITLVNDTVGGAVNITINTIDTTGAAGNPFDQVLNTTSSVNFTAINTTGNATSSFFIGNGSFLMGIPTNATVDAKGTSNLTANDTVYGAGWDGKTAEVPSQNAVYDKIELVADSNSYALKNQTKSLSIYNITTAHDILLWKTPKAITITNITAVCTGGTSVTGMIAECNATGQTCVDANSTIVVAAGTQVDTGAPTDASIDALDWLFWNTSAVSGTPTNFAVTIKYNE